jgi:sortase A
VAGHRLTHAQPLYELPSLRPGDVVEGETADAVYTYQLSTNPNRLTVQPRQTWVLDPVPGQPRDTRATRARITLTTCAHLFPTGERMVAFGRLIHTESKPD